MTNSNTAPHPGESFSEYRERLRAFGVKMPTEKMIKTPKEIEGCREAGRINSLVLDRVEREISVGMSTADIDAIVVSELSALGATSATLGYEGFPASVCTSVNSVICHGIPSRNEILREGDIINVDCTSVYGGYFGDASRMFSFGKISDSARRLIVVTREAVEMCVAAIKPYETRLGDIGHIINSHAKKNGFSVVREIGGHGVGLAMHEDPFVCHTGLPGRGLLLVPGMIFTVEPMINEGRARFYIDQKDGWTVRTLDGKLSAQIEYELLVTESGVEILSK
ncbi:MAG: type I methionyl aminopeptidase [Clostridia bacterium]|nr:type I methionyl aminopeptidase [Clostridia bacterium]MBP3583028.1 type I methionyl aminopeptidase [Clostridia bacterium]